MPMLGDGHIWQKPVSSTHLSPVAPQSRTRWISNFPPELLTRIFAYLALGSRVRGRWYAFLHVCTHWRYVALGAPALWVRPDFSRPGLVETMLARSGTMPLDVRIKLPVRLKTSTESAVKTVLHRWPQIRSLAVKGQRHDFATIIEPLVFRSVSVLQSLRITVQNDENAGTPYLFPQKSLEDFAPDLRSLDLTGCAVCWDRLASSTLTKLVVNFCSDDASDGLFQALRGIPSLQTIEITSTSTEWAAADPSSLPVNVPNLSELKFTGHPNGCYAFAQNLKLPLGCRVELDCSESTKKMEYDDEQDAIGTACHAVDTYMAIRNASSLQCSTVTVDYLDLFMDRVALAFSTARDSPPFLILTIDSLSKVSDLFGVWAHQCIKILVVSGYITSISISSGDHLYDLLRLLVSRVDGGHESSMTLRFELCHGLRHIPEHFFDGVEEALLTIEGWGIHPTRC